MPAKRLKIPPCGCWEGVSELCGPAAVTTLVASLSPFLKAPETQGSLFTRHFAKCPRRLEHHIRQDPWNTQQTHLTGTSLLPWAPGPRAQMVSEASTKPGAKRW